MTVYVNLCYVNPEGIMTEINDNGDSAKQKDLISHKKINAKIQERPFNVFFELH